MDRDALPSVLYLHYTEGRFINSCSSSRVVVIDWVPWMRRGPFGEFTYFVRKNISCRARLEIVVSKDGLVTSERSRNVKAKSHVVIKQDVISLHSESPKCGKQILFSYDY